MVWIIYDVIREVEDEGNSILSSYLSVIYRYYCKIHDGMAIQLTCFSSIQSVVNLRILFSDRWYIIDEKAKRLRHEILIYLLYLIKKMLM